MGERPDHEQAIDLERGLENRKTSIGLALRRCQRKGWQPRDYFLRATAQMQNVPETVTEAVALQQKLVDFPEVDWQTADRQALVDKLFELAKPLLTTEYEQGRGNVERAEHWQPAGMLHYELYNPNTEPAIPELGTEPVLIVHLPSQAESVSREELFSSLKELAKVLINHPEVRAIRGTSLLLEHPLFQRLGFRIDEKRDDELTPTSLMAREEFLKRYG